MPAGQVKQIAAGNGGGRVPSKARYASLAMVSDTLIPDTGGGRSRTETCNRCYSCRFTSLRILRSQGWGAAI